MDGNHSEGELNIVPYLDILMNLIIFMLLSMAGLATYGMVNINAPHTAPPGEGRETQALTLTVTLERSGFVVAASGGVLPLIPRRVDGHYDFEALTAKLRELKATFPHETKVIIAAEADTAYDALISTVDAAREAPDRTVLFPDVTLAHF
mgnify:CR=1 FL=1